MYSQNTNAFQKHYDEQPPYGQPSTTSFPLSSTTSYFSSDNSHSHPSSAVPPVRLQSKPRVDWSSGLCDCFSDVRNCCLTCWCPCITFGRIAEIVDKGSTSCRASGALYTLMACVTFCPCFYSCFYRSKMRRQYMLKKRPCGDCLVHCCCEACALCQEYRELRHRGFDMVIGWHGNVEQRNKELVMMTPPTAPTVESGMSR